MGNFLVETAIFQLHQKEFSGHSIHQKEDLTLAECQELCEETADCKSFVFGSRAIPTYCILKDEISSAAPGDLTSNSECDYYEKISLPHVGEYCSTSL